MEQLNKLRNRIDLIDSQIASLLNERMMAVDQVGKLKSSIEQVVVDPAREDKILQHVEEIVQHPILKEYIRNIYSEIMRESKIAQQFARHPKQPFRSIGILGLGLMGGSICKAIKMKDPTVEIATVIYESEDNFLAKEGGWIDRQYSSIQELVNGVELIILATPISSIYDLAEKIKAHHRGDKDLLVMDIASVKNEVSTLFQDLSGKSLEYVSTHPMAGKEKEGFVNSQATLFVNRPWIVIPHKNNKEDSLLKINELIHFLGSSPITMGAIEHDEKVALVSHIPLLLAKSYFDFVNFVKPDSLQITGPGFHSFTRLAQGSDGMRNEISNSNRKFIQNYLEQWLEFLKRNEQ